MEAGSSGDIVTEELVEFQPAWMDKLIITCCRKPTFMKLDVEGFEHATETCCQNGVSERSAITLGWNKRSRHGYK
jgi:hypothetical protein